MALITPQELQDELNIDDDILAVDAELYNRLIKTLATSMYYDRELSNGYSTGVRIMLTNLRSEIVGATNA